MKPYFDLPPDCGHAADLLKGTSSDRSISVTRRLRCSAESRSYNIPIISRGYHFHGVNYKGECCTEADLSDSKSIPMSASPEAI
jgi:hypothetical protein